ncbi:MAG: dipeptidase [Anaerolineae bacterium]
MIADALAYARAHRQALLEALQDFLRIPSVSTQPEHRGDIQRAAEWVAGYLRGMGMSQVEVVPTGGHPLVYGAWLGAGPEAPTLLVYGHYDVQPVDPLEEWQSPPFEPVVRGESLYARGASDNKGQVMAVLGAAEAYLKTSGRLPLNLKVLVEGEEEITSPHLGEAIRRDRARFAAHAVLICDEAILDPQTPLLMYGLRGTLSLEVEVRGPAHDLHSGTFGGAVDNPLNVLVHLLGALQDPQTRRIAVPGFYDRVRPVDPEERALLARVPVTDEVARHLTGAPALAGEEGYTTVERVSIRPSLDLHGLWGGYTGPGHKSVIPARAGAKFSMRLVPDQEPDEIAEQVIAYLRAVAPPTVALTVRILGKARPVLTDYRTPAVQAMAEAFQQGFGAPPIYMRAGGSIPIARDLQEILDAPLVLVGFGLPDDNTHAPNEKLYLPNLWRGVETLVHYYQQFACVGGSH